MQLILIVFKNLYALFSMMQWCMENASSCLLVCMMMIDVNNIFRATTTLNTVNVIGKLPRFEFCYSLNFALVTTHNG